MKRFLVTIALAVTLFFTAFGQQDNEFTNVRSGWDGNNYWITYEFTLDSTGTLLSSVGNNFTITDFDGVDWTTHNAMYAYKLTGTYSDPTCDIRILGWYNGPDDTTTVYTIAINDTNETIQTGAFALDSAQARGYRILLRNTGGDVEEGYLTLIFTAKESLLFNSKEEFYAINILRKKITF